MLKNIIIPIVATALFIAAVGIFIKKSSDYSFMTPAPSTKQNVPVVTINDKGIGVEIARTPEERIKGLSGRDFLDADSGMLFVFEEEKGAQVFWMKETLIPLDIIWIKDGKIIEINKNVPVPAKNTPDNKLSTYSAGVPVDYVLEVNAGFSDSNSIKVGDSVSVSGI